MKFCHRCQRNLSKEAFAKNRNKKDGLQSQCRECKSKTDKIDYRRNERKEQVRARVAAQAALLRDYVLNYLVEHPCVDCGNDDWRVLEFDHVRGEKLYNVSQMTKSGYSFESLLQEIAKCEVRCANCHRIRTRETLWEVDKLVKSPASEAGAL